MVIDWLWEMRGEDVKDDFQICEMGNSQREGIPESMSWEVSLNSDCELLEGRTVLSSFCCRYRRDSVMVYKTNDSYIYKNLY